MLTADFGFKQAVASGDKVTIDSVLLNHRQRVIADLMALVSLDGYSYLMMLDGQLYQVIMLTIDAPRPMAIAVVGFKLNSAILTKLNEITQFETTLQVFTEKTQVYKISTLPEK